MMNLKAFIFLYAAVVFLAFTALLSDLTHLNAELIVLGRTAFAAPILFCCIKPRSFFLTIKSTTTKNRLYLLASGILLCFHWLFFFQSIESGSVAIGLLTLASTPVFLIVMNLISGIQRHWRQDALTCLIILIGIYIMIPKDFNSEIWPWIYGLLSALFVAIFAFLNKQLVRTFKPIEISMTQTALCIPILLCFVSAQDIQAISTEQWLYLAACGIFCTALAQTLLLYSLRHIPALKAMFVINLEPVIGILLAVLILGDTIPTLQLVGGAIVFFGVIFSGIQFQHKSLVVNEDGFKH